MVGPDDMAGNAAVELNLSGEATVNPAADTDDDDDDVCGEDEADELDDLLDSIDIDKDFNLSSSSLNSKEDAKNDSSQEEAVEPIDWDERLHREEVFSPKYNPSAAELAELFQLEVFLGFASTGRGLTRIIKAASSRRMFVSGPNRLVLWKAVARPENEAPSVLMKRGPCGMSVGAAQQDVELLVLSRGLVVVTTKVDPVVKAITSAQFHAAVAWEDIAFVQPTKDGFGWTIQTKEDAAADDFAFVCDDEETRQSWMHALETVLVHYHELLSENSDTTSLGWQYHYVYRPGFTLAVTNRLDLEVPSESGADLNGVDEYNGLAPLHYAVKHNHVPAIAHLLEAGADPNIKDGEDQTPLYCAVREELSETTMELLQKHGAIRSKDIQKLEKGELFGKVAATEEVMEEKHRKEKVKKDAEAAALEIKQNMKLLQERGEKIDELGDKASTLNQNAKEYAQMAKQLKEAGKKKKFGMFKSMRIPNR